MKTVEAIAHFDEEGKPTPYRIKVQENEKSVVIKIKKVISFQSTELVGNKLYVYECNALLHEQDRFLQLKYEVKTCRWFLSKI